MSKTINFQRLEIFDDVAHSSCTVVDAREQFANVVYRMGNGIAAHALALKIYRSDGPTEYDDAEVALIRRFAERCAPAFIDAMQAVLGDSGA